MDTYFADRVEDGLEGILVKRLESPYQAGKRNFNWIKLKGSYKGGLSDSLDCAIVGYWRGRGKRTAWGIGAILTAVWDADDARLKTIARVGTGFSDEEWVQIRELLDKDARDEPPRMLDSTVEADVWVEPRLRCAGACGRAYTQPQPHSGAQGRRSGICPAVSAGAGDAARGQVAAGRHHGGRSRVAVRGAGARKRLTGPDTLYLGTYSAPGRSEFGTAGLDSICARPVNTKGMFGWTR